MESGVGVAKPRWVWFAPFPLSVGEHEHNGFPGVVWMPQQGLELNLRSLNKSNSLYSPKEEERDIPRERCATKR